MITVGFFSNNSFFTNIIKWFTGSDINHCAIGLIKDNKQYWLQAGVGGVQLVDRSWLSGLCAEFQVLPNIENEVELAEKKIGEPYAFLTFLALFLFC